MFQCKDRGFPEWVDKGHGPVRGKQNGGSIAEGNRAPMHRPSLFPAQGTMTLTRCPEKGGCFKVLSLRLTDEGGGGGGGMREGEGGCLGGRGREKGG